jgi:uncharacterized protein (UPF0218 family)
LDRHSNNFRPFRFTDCRSDGSTKRWEIRTTCKIAANLNLTDHLRARLRRPLGRLIAKPPGRAMDELSEMIFAARPPRTVAVGDRVSRNASRRIFPDIYITDDRIMRRKIETQQLPCEKIFRVSNPRSTITVAAWNAVKEALEANGTARIMVDGEEDLLTLPSIILSPEGSLVFYGQPKEGLVVVEASREKKREICGYLKEMSALHRKVKARDS